MTTKYDMNCPKCDNPLGFLEQLTEWVDMCEGDCGTPAFLNLWCKHCEDMTSSIQWLENGEAEEVEVPSLRDITGGIDRVVFNKPLEDTDDDQKED